MQVIADLQLHSRFSRAVSSQMTIPHIAAWAAKKGISLVATGDWTHPLWFREIQANLEEIGSGLLKLRHSLVTNEKESLGAYRVSPFDSSRQGPDRVGVHQGLSAKAMTGLENASRAAPSSTTHNSQPTTPLFLLATEVSCIYSQGGKLRRIHTLVWVPSLASADKINRQMTKRGCNLMSDGRPIIGLTSIQLAELVLSAEPKALITPAHAWTPWFSLYGSMSGFDSIDEAFGPFAKHIYAIETGLSSSPSMNWRIAELDSRSIVSFSDAHSGPKLGREATVFEIPEGKLGYEAIYQAIQRGGSGGSHIAYTIEFYPEEGKYHYTGHRLCNVRFSPEETKKKGRACPVCGKPLTIGVMHRVEELAGRSAGDLKLEKVKIPGALVEGTRSIAFPEHAPFVMLVPLQEILAEAIGSPVTSPKVQEPYERLTQEFDGEFALLLNAPLTEITKAAGERVAHGIDKVRRGDIVIDPGYDGVFGVVKIWKEGEEKPLLDSSKKQLTMF